MDVCWVSKEKFFWWQHQDYFSCRLIRGQKLWNMRMNVSSFYPQHVKLKMAINMSAVVPLNHTKKITIFFIFHRNKILSRSNKSIIKYEILPQNRRGLNCKFSGAFIGCNLWDFFLQKQFFILHNHHQNFCYWMFEIPSLSGQTRILMTKDEKYFFFQMKIFCVKIINLKYALISSMLVLQIYYELFLIFSNFVFI